MSEYDAIGWECDGRLPVLEVQSRRCLNAEERAAAQSLVDACGSVLFRRLELTNEEFVRATEQLAGRLGVLRMAPDAGAPNGPRIALHTEDAMLPSIPAWIFFYVIEPAMEGGETVLCDGASVVSSLGHAAQSFLAEDDILYWWRTLTPTRRHQRSIVGDPPGVDRNYRGPFVEQEADWINISALCRPIIRSRVGGRRVFGNHILNALEHDPEGGPPRVDGFHRARTPDRKPLPADLIAELNSVTSSLQFCVKLDAGDLLWLDNTRFLHGRAAFTGPRRVMVRKSYHSGQLRQ